MKTPVHTVGAFVLGVASSSAMADDLRVLGVLDGPVPEVPIIEIAAGTYHALGLDASGGIHAWGLCIFDSVGNPCGGCEPPSDFGGGRRAVRLAAGSRHSMALLDDGAVACWGCEPEACDVPSDLREAPADPVIAIAAGEGHSLALLASGELRCWGRLVGAGVDPCEIPAAATDPTNPPVAIAATREVSVARLADGTVVAWGGNVPSTPAVLVESMALVEPHLYSGSSQPRLVSLLTDGRVWLDGDVIAFDPANPCVAVAGGAWPAAILADDVVRFLDQTGDVAPFPLPGRLGLEPWRSTQIVGGQDFLLSIAVPEDCDANGVPDRDQIAEDPSLDCNGTGRLDICDRRRQLDWAGDFEVDGVSIDLTDEPPLDLDAEFFVVANGDLSTQAEHLVVEFNGRQIATLFAEMDLRDDCVPRTASFSISPKTWASGVRVLTIRSSEAVDPDLCADSGFTVSAELGRVVADCNGNGLDDGCEVLAGTVPDVDGDLQPDECAPDCDLDGTPDAWAVFQREVEDCDGDGEPDSCEIAVGSELDCDGNGRPDRCDLADGTLTDVDGNGWPDECDLIPGDLDYDGCVGAADLGILLSLWNATDQSDADLDGDGIVRAGDLGILLANWGECL